MKGVLGNSRTRMFYWELRLAETKRETPYATLAGLQGVAQGAISQAHPRLRELLRERSARLTQGSPQAQVKAALLTL
jgi:hypothetical protein